MIQGKVARQKDMVFTAHINANYRFYMGKTCLTYPQRPVFVVRTSHLWDDMKQIDRMLSGDGDFGALEGSRYTHGSETRHGNSSLTKAALEGLCCALHAEILLYRDLLQMAVNLREDEKQETLLDTSRRCGAESFEQLEQRCHKIMSSLAG